MTKKYNQTTLDIIKGIRGQAIPQGGVMQNKKDKEKRKDIKKGRQDWSKHISESKKQGVK